MAVIRRFNAQGQERIDVPHLRLIEEGVAGDLDALAGAALAGGRPLVVAGFQLAFAGISAATALQLRTAGGVLFHPTATEGGTVYSVPITRATEVLSGTNPRVSGAFLPNSINYVGADLVRQADDSTSDIAFFLDSTSGEESPKPVDLARTMDYRIVISTQDFSVNTNLAPLAIVVTDASGNVTSVRDARSLMFRLGSGGTSPDALHTYSFPGGRTDSTNDFAAADRSIGDLKSWLDAIMTRIWELGGGERWFSGTADRNITLTAIPPTFVSSGENFEWDGTNLHWRGLMVLFDNSTGSRNQVADQTVSQVGLTDLADGDCVYVDLDRTQDHTGGAALVAARSSLLALGLPTVPGSRFVLAWRRGTQCFYRGKTGPIGSFAIPAATTLIIGAVMLSGTPAVVGSPVAATVEAAGRAMVSGITRAGYVGGNGLLAIGPDATADTGITYGNTSMAGGHTFDALAGVASTVLLRNATDSNVTPSTRSLQVQQKHAGVTKNVFYVDGAGGLVSPVSFYDPPTPPSGYVTRYFKLNGIASPNSRVQYCAKFDTGQVLVMSESDPS